MAGLPPSETITSPGVSQTLNAPNLFHLPEGAPGSAPLGLSVHLQRFSTILILLFAASAAFLGYRSYNADVIAHPLNYPILLSGQGPAPAQYRVGVVFAAQALHRLTHIPLHAYLACFDFVFAAGAAFLLRSVLVATASFQQAGHSGRLVRLVLLALFFSFYLNWSAYYQRPETFACTFFVACSLYVLTRTRPPALTVSILLLLSLLQGFVRADVAILFYLGVFLRAGFVGSRGFSLPRTALLLTSFFAFLLPTAILYILIHVIFPHATYGDTKVVQLLLNLRPQMLFPFALFMVPTLYTYSRALRHRSALSGPFSALLLASLFYLGSWAILGRLEEVRIFVPFAFALIPLTIHFLIADVEPL